MQPLFWPGRGHQAHPDFSFWCGNDLVELRRRIPRFSSSIPSPKVPEPAQSLDTNFMVDLVLESMTEPVASTQRTGPIIIGIAGSVAVGKSSLAEAVAHTLGQLLEPSKVATVSTDGFLYSKEVLIDRRLMDRKGFPESYDRTALLSFLSRVSRGEARLPVPGYSHDLYDVVDDGQTLGPDVSIVILEGLNILQDPGTVLDQLDNAWVRSYLAFSLFLDADEADLRRWYIQRSMKLRSAGEPAVKDGDPRKGRSTALRRLEERWTKINAVNLAENILPSRINADMVIRLGEEHDVIGVALARLDRNGRIFDLGRQSLECSNYV